ncbi:uncharacterized protein LOC118192123 [Stegodyphus dumicola]|uniref:uncharacterized protein LOC118192123 n=1 Tax=Stegodyphus dumicola TaxID=202533 RepID=UPI0015AC2281|nr:uncharacterized protein LOC118192123 [Stegodyphus dumicola]
MHDFSRMIVFKTADPRKHESTFISQSTILSIFITGSWALDCFKCISIGGEYPPCDDPFHNNYTQDILETPCWAGRKQRNGVFPATTCVKLAGVYDDTGESLVVRGCAVDSGTLTIDTELVRMSHCGGFYYENRYVRGCVQNCFDDGCNASPLPYARLNSMPFIVLLCSLNLFLLKQFRLFD